MDTMLGLDNTGADRFKYYEDDSNEAIYNGKEVLWNFVKDNLSSEIRDMFNEAEAASALTEETILTYIGDQQANLPNAAMYNGDADYKYTGPAREGYYDFLNKKEIAPGAGPYLYAAQGNRDLMRTNWVNNRMRFLRGKRESNNFYNGDRIEFRWYYPTQSDSDPDLVESIKRVAPNGDFDLTALQVGYAGVVLGANAGDSKIVQKFGQLGRL